MVVPLSVLGNWEREVGRWCPGLNASSSTATRTSASRKEKLLHEPRKYHVVVTTYEMVGQETAALKKVDFEMMVIDEAHRLKNETSRLATLLRAHRAAAPL